MHSDLAEKLLELVRLRVSQGDTPTEPALSRENLEDLVLTMDASLTALRQRVVEVVGPFAGMDVATVADYRAARALINEIKETTDGH